MTRLVLPFVIAVLTAILLAAAFNIGVVRPALRPRPELATSPLHPMVGLQITRIDEALAGEALAGAPDARSLSERAGAPVMPISPAELAAAPWKDAPVRLRGSAGDYLVRSLGHDEIELVLQRDGPPALRIGPVDVRRGPDPFEASIAISVVLFFAALMGLIVATPLARGVDLLLSAARRIRDGDLTARAGQPRVTAPRELLRTFDAMADRIQSLLESQRHLLQAVSHELRTPAARVRFNLDLLADAGDDEARARRIASIDEDLTEMDSLIGELLTFTRVTGAGQQTDRAPVALREPLGELLDEVHRHSPGISATLTAEDPSVVALIARAAFARAVRNLLSNAVRHAAGRVTVRLARRGDMAIVEVSDDGPGVPPADRDRVFEPFSRLDASRARDGGGVGLGLAIVRRIVEAHGGTITLDESPLGGARFTSTWPI